ncbi:asparagine synthase-related protein [Aequorivita viscosa]|uniref:asparagine synthase (glutamine-hydrolyzing) n=1 Tax=Aequorivita viscosa TaxID=797419 RepID=A0A1M6GI53_9FLAO|nr:asparagine synthase-related protein [Aequorivita viscosa]SDW84172.1 Asparagine synthase [Aequorivita viscosa]SHJ09647.1 Asparagine synthase [Aequorivita viscosa]
MNKHIKTPIIPYRSDFVGEKHTLDLEAICVYAAVGFFLDTDTFYKELKTLRPFTDYVISEDNKRVIEEKPYFKWHYSPIERPFDQIVQEFAALFETIVADQSVGRKVILPLSGGLDSRTQAAALAHLKIETNSYSYSFSKGHDETKYSRKIAEVCGFPFQSWEVPKGYLWNVIEDLARINDCYSEFTHPRQMAFLDKYKELGDVFSLGHLGDLVFDDMGVDDKLPFESQVNHLFKIVIKKGGLTVGNMLWESWGLKGDFEQYIRTRIESLLSEIDIQESANAQIRAFKNIHWVPRWTNTNLSVFESQRPMELPYYDDRMCEFICTVPEKYLADRQIQIAYLKLRNPDLARITWEAQRPFNLYNYHLNKAPYNLPYRVIDKAKRTLKPHFTVQRNWELQFLGDDNQKQLKKWLFENPNFKNFVAPEVVTSILNKFNSDNAVTYSHPLSMLLTLSVFAKHNQL